MRRTACQLPTWRCQADLSYDYSDRLSYLILAINQPRNIIVFDLSKKDSVINRSAFHFKQCLFRSNDVSDWNPTQYLRYGSERLRPALDLISRIQVESPDSVYDLGCGTGTVTGILQERWPKAKITGVDSSASMLERTRDIETGVYWQHADLNDWQPESLADVVYSNAALHWLDNHGQLFPRIIDGIKPGGVLAIQMPKNFSAPSHTSIADTVREGPWRERLAPFQREQPVAEPSYYYDLISQMSSSIDMWETTYMHILEGANPVVEWTKGTMLRPLLDNLNNEEAEAFLKLYTEKVAKAYPHSTNGKTVLPFKRLFIIAVK